MKALTNKLSKHSHQTTQNKILSNTTMIT